MSSKNSWQKRLSLFQKLWHLFSSPAKEIILNDLLGQKTDNLPLAEKIYWLEQILRWLFQERSDSTETRCAYFFQVLEKNPSWKTNFQQTLNVILNEGRFLSLFTEIGLAVEHGLWGDILDRLVKKILPSGGNTDFREMLLNCFASPGSIEQLAQLSDTALAGFKGLAYTAENQMTWRDLRSESQEALLFLCAHVAHYGLSSDIRNRLPRTDKISKSPFFRLSQDISRQTTAQLAAVVLECEKSVEAVYASLEASGVSVDAVNRLETISLLLEQIRSLLQLTEPRAGLEKARQIEAFLAMAANTGLKGRSVLGHLSRHFYLLSRKIVERNAHSGEHYIARSRAELRLLFTSALGGGLIVVVMTILKTWLIYLGLAPLFLALGIWIIYAVGFLSMQFFGFTLATKIPSFTASRLAGLLRKVRKHSAHEFRAELRLVLKSQAIALLGNVACVIPLALLVNYCFGKLTAGSRLMPEHYALHSLHDLNPIFSFALPLGALTGIELWISSMVGGWFENWVVFHRLPEAVEYNFQLRKFFGEKAAKRWATRVLKHSSGVATNLSLGFLFGFLPLVGGLLGLNWNGNHVTISTAGAFFALSSLHFQVSSMDWVYLATGLLAIGALNFLVSFGLALLVAGNSQKMKLWRVLHYLRSGLTPQRASARAQPQPMRHGKPNL